MLLRCVAAAVLAVLLVSCASARTASTGSVSSATAMLRDASGATVGTATLTQTAAGVLVSASFTGLGSGTHGIHVHETGRCEPPAFTSAGGHFNPERKQHGFRNPAGPHAGDMPNVSLPAAGALTADLLLPRASLSGERALLDTDGAAIVVHAAADDYQTDPSGNSGSRVACGVITAR